MNKAKLNAERRAEEKNFKTQFQKDEMEVKRHRDARMSKKLGEICQMLL